MKNLFATILSVLLLVSCSGVETVVVAYDASTADYTPVVREILLSHPRGNVTLEFENAVYPFYPEKAFCKYVRVSNNDNSDKKIAFDICGMENVSVKGDSSLFLFHGAMVPFLVERSENVSLSGFAITYDCPFVLEGTVVASDSAGRTFEIAVHKENPYSVKDGRLLFRGYDWELGLGENIFFNPETRSPYYSTENYETDSSKELQATDLGNGIVRLSGSTARQMPPVGAVLVDKGPYTHNRLYPGIAVQGCRNVLLEDVTVHDSGAMALIVEKTENICCRRYSTKVREGSGRMIAASADATHFINCKGKVTLEDCMFESMLDDATNIHGTFMKLDRILSDNEFAASFGHVQQEGFDFAGEGDTLLFINREGLGNVGTGVVKSIVKENDNRYIITTDFSLAGYDSLSMAVGNLSWSAAALIERCTVRHNRARSLLISTPGPVLIENCDFASMMAGIRICGDANYWFEAGRTNDVIIRNNTFKDLSNGGWSPQAVLQIDPVIAKPYRSNDDYFHRKIVFEGNTVYSFEDQLIYALSTETLVIKDNKFIDSHTFPVRYPGLAVIDLQYCGKVDMSGNDFSAWKPDASVSVHNCAELDTDTTLPVTDKPNPYFFEN